jgi:hypothetical protein
LASLKELKLLYLYENKLTGLLPPLSFSQHTEDCVLDLYACVEPHCNHFKCPLPPGSDECQWEQPGFPPQAGVHCK